MALLPLSGPALLPLSDRFVGFCGTSCGMDEIIPAEPEWGGRIVVSRDVLVDLI
jgi:hypothetical protein